MADGEAWQAHPDLAPDLGSHRLLGDGRAAALLRADGEVDWWCAPAMDSTPLLWSLLDPAGGAARFPGARYADADPEPAGRLLRTRLRIDRTPIDVVDGLLAVSPDEAPALVRLVRGVEGPLRVCHELCAGGFDGVPVADWTIGPSPDTAASASLSLRGGQHAVAGPVLRTTLTGPAGVWQALVIGVGPLPEGTPEQLLARLEASEAELRAEVAAARLPRRHAHRAADALRVLDACTYRPTGAVVASPTTSLPEAIGADRQFDYRFTWLRDASLAVSVAALLGRPTTAATFLDFVQRRVTGNPLDASPVLDIRDEQVPPERSVRGVRGWAGTTPIRLGNSAAGQVQADALGLVCESVSVHLQTGGGLDGKVWRLVCVIADGIARQVLEDPEPRPGAGIWEFREPRPLVSEDLGRFLALDRAVWVARGWRPWTRRRRWLEAREVVRARVLDALLPNGGLPQAYDDDPAQPTYDASALMATVFGLLDGDDPRASRLVEVTLAHLGAGPHVYRYEPGPVQGNADDGFQGREGAFVAMSWWAVAALAQLGRVHEARDRALELDRTLPRLLSEQVDPASGRGLGNTPLLWSHMAAARALYVLDAAERREQYGQLGLTLWRLGRFLALRRQHRAGRSKD